LSARQSHLLNTTLSKAHDEVSGEVGEKAGEGEALIWEELRKGCGKP
jgi:hypothetical protein